MTELKGIVKEDIYIIDTDRLGEDNIVTKSLLDEILFKIASKGEKAESAGDDIWEIESGATIVGNNYIELSK